MMTRSRTSAKEMEVSEFPTVVHETDFDDRGRILPPRCRQDHSIR